METPMQNNASAIFELLKQNQDFKSLIIEQQKENEFKNLTEESKEKALKASDSNLGGDVPTGLLYVLCFFIPWLAVGLATDWDIKKVIINILWTMLCGIPGIIHAFIVVSTVIIVVILK